VAVDTVSDGFQDGLAFVVGTSMGFVYY